MSQTTENQIPDLRAARERAGLRQEEVAVEIGCTTRSIWSWESKGRLPKNPKIRALYLRALGLDKLSQVEPSHG